jgi:signal peptidase II
VGVLLLAAVIVAADRATKEIALHKLAFRPHAWGLLRVVVNRRPFLFRGASPRALVILWVTAVACALGALMCAPAFRDNPLVTAGIAAALSGASGNLGDRLVRGAVVDFMAIGRWPVFNLADLAILAGVAIAGASFF